MEITGQFIDWYRRNWIWILHDTDDTAGEVPVVKSSKKDHIQQASFLFSTYTISWITRCTWPPVESAVSLTTTTTAKNTRIIKLSFRFVWPDIHFEIIEAESSYWRLVGCKVALFTTERYSVLLCSCIFVFSVTSQLVMTHFKLF